MLDDMWQIHLHIMLLQRRYYRMFGKKPVRISDKTNILRNSKNAQNRIGLTCRVKLCKTLFCDMANRKTLFFQNIEDRKAGLTPRKVGRPKIKPRHKYSSMTFTQAGYTLEGNRIKINCIDTWFSFHRHREIKGTIKTITLKRDRCGDYWICFFVREC